MKITGMKLISIVLISIFVIQVIICAENYGVDNYDQISATDATDVYNDSDNEDESINDKNLAAKISFDANGGVNAPKAIFVNDEGAAEIPFVEPSYNNYVFIGWATQPDAIQSEYEPGDCAIFTEDTTLYALWLNCKISKKSTERRMIIQSNLLIPELTVWIAAYYEDSMVAIKYLSIQLNIGENIIETKIDWNNVEKDEIKVFPWNENLKPYTDSQEVGIAKKYEVTFMDWDGTIISEQSVFAGENAELPDEPSREDYDFLCWDGVYKNVFNDSRVIAIYERIVEDIDTEKDYWYTGKRISYLGDSLTANGSGGQFRTYVNDYFGFSNETVSAFGGTLISGEKNSMGEPFWYDSRVNAIDLDSDVVLIFGGTNDANNNIELGECSITNSDTSTFYGAYNVLLSKLMYKFYGNIQKGFYDDIDYSKISRNRANEISATDVNAGFVDLTGDFVGDSDFECAEFSVEEHNTYYLYGSWNSEIPLVVFFDKEKNVIQYELSNDKDISCVEAYDIVAPTGAVTMIVNHFREFDEMKVYELPFEANAPYDYRQFTVSRKNISKRIMDEKGQIQQYMTIVDSEGNENVIECSKYSCAEYDVDSNHVYFITGNCNEAMPLYIFKNDAGEILETYNDRDSKPWYNETKDPEKNVYIRNLEVSVPAGATKLYVNNKSMFNKIVYAVPFISNLPLEYRHINLPKSNIYTNTYMNTFNKMISDDDYEIFEYDVKEGYQYLVSGFTNSQMPLLTIVDKNGTKLSAVSYGATQNECCEDYPIIVPAGGVKMYVNTYKYNNMACVKGIGKPIKIFLVTPPYMLSSVSQYNKVPNYADAVVNIGKMYGIPVCDIRAESSINIFNAEIYKGWGEDGVHLNTAAHKQWANVIINKMIEVEPIG